MAIINWQWITSVAGPGLGPRPLDGGGAAWMRKWTYKVKSITCALEASQRLRLIKGVYNLFQMQDPPPTCFGLTTHHIALAKYQSICLNKRNDIENRKRRNDCYFRACFNEISVWSFLLNMRTKIAVNPKIMVLSTSYRKRTNH